jgi:hypothetical protein
MESGGRTLSVVACNSLLDRAFGKPKPAAEEKDDMVLARSELLVNPLRLVSVDQPAPQLVRVFGQPLAHGLGRRRQLRSGLRFLDALGAAVETGRARGDPHDAASSRRDVEHIERQRMNDGGKRDFRIVGQPSLQRGGAVPPAR